MSYTGYATYKTITSGGSYTKEQKVNHDQKVQVSVYGKFEAVVSIQVRRPDQNDEEDWRDLDETHLTSEIVYDFAGDWVMRAGVKDGDYTSGTIQIEIS